MGTGKPLRQRVQLLGSKMTADPHLVSKLKMTRDTPPNSHMRERKETIFFFTSIWSVVKNPIYKPTRKRITFFYVRYPVVLLIGKNKKVPSKQLKCLHYFLLQHVSVVMGHLQVNNCLKTIKFASNFVVVINLGIAYCNTLRYVLLCLICWLKFQSISYETLQYLNCQSTGYKQYLN
jgi:hypothetical protein